MVRHAQSLYSEITLTWGRDTPSDKEVQIFSNVGIVIGFGIQKADLAKSQKRMARQGYVYYMNILLNLCE